MQLGVDDLLDEEVGALSDAVGRLKGMASHIGHESVETGKIQEALAQQLEHAQVAMQAGVQTMKRIHRDMASSCGHMTLLVVYVVVLVVFVVAFGKIRALLRWIF